MPRCSSGKPCARREVVAASDLGGRLELGDRERFGRIEPNVGVARVLDELDGLGHRRQLHLDLATADRAHLAIEQLACRMLLLLAVLGHGEPLACFYGRRTLRTQHRELFAIGDEQDRAQDPQPERPDRRTLLHDHRKRTLGIELGPLALGDESSRVVVAWPISGRLQHAMKRTNDEALAMAKAHRRVTGLSRKWIEDAFANPCVDELRTHFYVAVKRHDVRCALPCAFDLICGGTSTLCDISGHRDLTQRRDCSRDKVVR
jgi:hypothetical protein